MGIFSFLMCLDLFQYLFQNVCCKKFLAVYKISNVKFMIILSMWEFVFFICHLSYAQPLYRDPNLQVCTKSPWKCPDWACYWCFKMPLSERWNNPECEHRDNTRRTRLSFETFHIEWLKGPANLGLLTIFSPEMMMTLLATCKLWIHLTKGQWCGGLMFCKPE